MSERFSKFVPVEAYPLIGLVVIMSTFGIGSAVRAFTAVPDELRLLPSKFGEIEGATRQRREPWKDE
ncbi:hypothetical protein OIO90_000732 [Microbotryomycetes sp. JL221]|nr:hypothetical protein OIO90_000732 [Microbotryomycetes sp. JL221]